MLVPWWITVALLFGLFIHLCNSGSQNISFGDNVREMRDSGDFDHFKTDYEQEASACIQRSNQLNCLSDFLAEREVEYAACLHIEGPKLCKLNLEVIAEAHGWSIPNVDQRATPLREDAGFTQVQADCIGKVDEFNCSSAFALKQDFAFEVCDRFWGEHDCEHVLGELIAAAKHSGIPTPTPTKR